MCFCHGEKTEIFQNGAQGDFHFLHGETHADTIPWTHSERHVSVGIGFDWAVGFPPSRR